MPTQHKVRSGECLSSIAARYGFSDYKTIYDHPDNAGLKKKRPNPNILHPGDVLAIPDKEEKIVDCATGKVHRFTVKSPTKKLHLKLQDQLGEALSFESYVLIVGGTGQVIEGDTDGDGVLEEEVPVGAETAELTVGGLRWNLRIGDLNPIDETDDDGVTGIQQRLKNLGIDPGPIDGILGPKTISAICVFEGLHGLEITGACEGPTLAKLKAVHGC